MISIRKEWLFESVSLKILSTHAIPIRCDVSTSRIKPNMYLVYRSLDIRYVAGDSARNKVLIFFSFNDLHIIFQFMF